MGLMDNVSHERCLRLASQGDKDAIQFLLVQQEPQLRRLLTRQRNGVTCQRYDEEDILQDAYVAVFRCKEFPQFESTAHFRAWFERIALNTARNQERYLRRQKRDIARDRNGRVGSRSSLPDLIERVAATDSTPSKRVSRAEAHAVLRSSLARLSDDQRAVIQLRFFERMSVGEVARHMDRSDEAIHALTYRAIVALRGHLGSCSRFRLPG